MSTAAAPVATVAAPKESILQKIEGVFEKDGQKVLTVMEIAAKECAKGLTWIVQYAPEIAGLVTVLFPAAAPAAAEAVNVADVVQKAVLQVEAAYAAAGINSEAGAKKSADVLTLVEGSVTTLLAQLGIKANTAYLQQIINAVVAILNVSTTTVTA